MPLAVPLVNVPAGILTFNPVGNRCEGKVVLVPVLRKLVLSLRRGI